MGVAAVSPSFSPDAPARTYRTVDGAKTSQRRLVVVMTVPSVVSQFITRSVRPVPADHGPVSVTVSSVRLLLLQAAVGAPTVPRKVHVAWFMLRLKRIVIVWLLSSAPGAGVIDVMAGAAGVTSAACEKLNRLKIEESGALSSEGRQLAALKKASSAT